MLNVGRDNEDIACFKVIQLPLKYGITGAVGYNHDLLWFVAVRGKVDVGFSSDKTDRDPFRGYDVAS